MPVFGQNLAKEKLRAIRRVNDMIGEARTVFITDIPGQSMIYSAKEAEAVRYLADPAPVLEDYPWISKEVGVTEDTPEALAQLWITMGDQWRQIGPVLEKVRLTGNKAIRACDNLAEIQAVEDQARTSMDEALAAAAAALTSVQ